MKIHFGDCEGPLHWGEHDCDSFKAANSFLYNRACQMATANDWHGYNKHKFDLLDDDGQVIYSGRYDLYAFGAETDEGTTMPDLYKHISDWLTRACPADKDAFLRRLTPLVRS